MVDHAKAIPKRRSQHSCACRRADQREFRKIQTEAVQALVALGYGSTESLRAVKKVDLEQAKTVEDVLKQALKNLF